MLSAPDKECLDRLGLVLVEAKKNGCCQAEVAVEGARRQGIFTFDTATDLRQGIAEDHSAKPDEYKGFFVHNDSSDEEALENHSKEFANKSIWGSHPHLYATQSLLKRPLEIYNVCTRTVTYIRGVGHEESTMPFPSGPVVHTGEEIDRPIRFIFSGDHYDRAEEVGRLHLLPKPPTEPSDTGAATSGNGLYSAAKDSGYHSAPAEGACTDKVSSASPAALVVASAEKAESVPAAGEGAAEWLAAPVTTTVDQDESNEDEAAEAEVPTKPTDKKVSFSKSSTILLYGKGLQAGSLTAMVLMDSENIHRACPSGYVGHFFPASGDNESIKARISGTFSERQATVLIKPFESPSTLHLRAPHKSFERCSLQSWVEKDLSLEVGVLHISPEGGEACIVFPSREIAHQALVTIHSIMRAEEADYVLVDGSPVYVSSLDGIEVRSHDVSPACIYSQCILTQVPLPLARSITPFAGAKWVC